MINATNAIYGLVLACPLSGQLVQIGPPDPHYCEKVERIQPNLKLISRTHIHGRLIDESNAPFREAKVELRRYVSPSKQVQIKAVITDRNGVFDLGAVAPGNYRLLPSSTRAFRQPDRLDCTKGQDECMLGIELKVNPTDLPESTCPVR